MAALLPRQPLLLLHQGFLDQFVQRHVMTSADLRAGAVLGHGTAEIVLQIIKTRRDRSSFSGLHRLALDGFRRAAKAQPICCDA